MVSMKLVEKMDEAALHLENARQILTDCGVNNARIMKVTTDESGEICQITVERNGGF
mgnify:CR=1 FL=1